MANHAAPSQLPSMVRNPKAVWPGLARMGMYQKQIAGDGNCLFASLSDQLYGTPAKHFEIRARIIEHMRAWRPLFEHSVHRDDVQQRRTLRSAASAASQEPDDAFEAYLTLMSKSGTYGGEPELVAFCQAYDQDVTVHLPRLRNFHHDAIPYTNDHRVSTDPVPALHICYGGDEITRAHYDSARSRDGSIPRSQNSPLLKAADHRYGKSIDGSSLAPDHSLSKRAIRGSRSEISSELIHDLIYQTNNDKKNSLDVLSDNSRRSPSVSSSYRSSSSKRSLDDEDDSEPVRSAKRTDRRKSTRRRAHIAIVSPDLPGDPSQPLSSLSVETPPSTQETTSSEDTKSSSDDNLLSNADTVDHRTVDNPGPLRSIARQRDKLQARTSQSINVTQDDSPSPRVMSVPERPKHFLET